MSTTYDAKALHILEKFNDESKEFSAMFQEYLKIMKEKGPFDFATIDLGEKSFRLYRQMEETNSKLKPFQLNV